MNYKKTLGFALLLSLLSTSSFAKSEGVGASTDLKAWGVTDHSAKIAFRDNTEGEDTFIITLIDDYGIFKTKEISASSGTGKMRIAKIGGLKRGVLYGAYVTAYSYKDDYIPVKINESDILPFKTKGEAEDYDGKVAKELKAWSIKKTSAVITFNANPRHDLDEITDDYAGQMLFINTETGKAIKLNSRGTVKLSNKNPNKNYYAAKLINLEPGTTYTVKLVFDMYMMGPPVDTDTMITFTTKE